MAIFFKRMKLKASEHQIQTMLMHYLQAKGWYVMRLNSGKFAVGEGSNRRFINGQEAGTPDLMAFKDIEYKCGHDTHVQTDLVFVEVKTPQNPKPTDIQERKMHELEEHGARCIVAHSLEELQEQL